MRNICTPSTLFWLAKIYGPLSKVTARRTLCCTMPCERVQPEVFLQEIHKREPRTVYDMPNQR